MNLKNIYEDGQMYYKSVWNLYEEAFPKEEQKSVEIMELLKDQGKMEIYAIEDQGEFIGLAMNMIWGDMGLLDYFAIAENKRNGGYGSRCIRLLLEEFKDRKYIFEIEKQDEQAENSADRKRRKAFYLRNGLKETGVFANVYQVDFELLTPDGDLTFEEYTDFLEHVLGKENLAKLNPVLIEEKR